MAFLELLVAASVPVLKVLLITGLGLYLALDHVDVLGASARSQMNQLVYLIFNPALVGGNLAGTVTSESFLLLWFMPVNILLTFIVGSALGWILVKITRTPPHLKGLVIGCCAAGNLGNMLLIIIPAVCKEKGSPFGDPNVCERYGLAYASLSLAIGAIYLWSYVYNIIRVTTDKTGTEVKTEQSIEDAKSSLESDKSVQDYAEPLLSSLEKVSVWCKVKRCKQAVERNVNLRSLLTPSTAAALVGFAIGVVPFFRHLLIGAGAPLRVLEDTASLLGGAAIPCVTLIMGGNLLKGMMGGGMQPSLVVGIVVVRYIFLPLFGIVIVKGAFYLGLIHHDPLYLFILLLQYALPPAMNLGTMMQLFSPGESECSVVMLWTYALASVAVTLWSTLFMWLVS